MQQGRSGMGSHKHGVSGHASESPRLRLTTRLAAERGEYGGASKRRSKPLEFATVQDALRTGRKPR
jgi:hypothetical protein